MEATLIKTPLPGLMAAIAALIAPGAAEEIREGDYLYHMMTLRADPGELENLLGWFLR